MAKLIVKSPYIKGKAGKAGKAGRYLHYIGTRENVELLEQAGGYMEYMVKRPRSHGLFGDENHVALDAAMEEINRYPGNIWTHIISLRREDAERLGYDHAEQWRNLLRAHRNEIATAMHIPPKDFRWYAAFHDEGSHPHVHMMAWSAKPGQAYLSGEGIRKIKSVLTNDIFKQEMLHVYEQKSASRDELVRQARAEMKSLAREMQQELCGSSEVEMLMLRLAAELGTVKGKKKYGYLPKNVKATVNEIVDELEKLPVVSECYDKWWTLQCEIEDCYSVRKRKRPPLSTRKEFQAIRNAVVQEAESIWLGAISLEDMEERPEDESESVSRRLSYDEWELWLTARDDTASMTDREEAARKLETLAEDGDACAQYLTGLLYRDGPAVIPDWLTAAYWFRQAAEKLSEAQYALGKLLLTNDPEIRNTEQGIQWLYTAVRNGNAFAAYRLGKEYLTGSNVVKDASKAAEYFTQAAEAGNEYAQYALGKLYLLGVGVEQDRAQAREWFICSAAQGNEYACYHLEHWNEPHPPAAMTSVIRLLYHISRIFEDNVPPAGSGSVLADRKLRERTMEKKMAMGHKPDDHEEQGWGGMTMG